jgi:transposase
MKKANIINGRKGQRGRPPKHDISFIRNVITRYQTGDQSIYQLAKEFNIPAPYIGRWTKQFSSELATEINISPMTEQEQRDQAALQKQIEALKKKLEFDEMKIFALETMIDLAKTELGIDIRKNFGAKQPKE